MIKIIGRSISPFVAKVKAAATYKDWSLSIESSLEFPNFADSTPKQGRFRLLFSRMGWFLIQVWSWGDWTKRSLRLHSFLETRWQRPKRAGIALVCQERTLHHSWNEEIRASVAEAIREVDTSRVGGAAASGAGIGPPVVWRVGCRIWVAIGRAWDIAGWTKNSSVPNNQASLILRFMVCVQRAILEPHLSFQMHFPCTQILRNGESEWTQ